MSLKDLESKDPARIRKHFERMPDAKLFSSFEEHRNEYGAVHDIVLQVSNERRSKRAVAARDAKRLKKEVRRSKDSANLTKLSDIRELITEATPSKFRQGMVFWMTIAAAVSSAVAAVAAVVGILALFK
jgi:hypothetical protein